MIGDIISQFQTPITVHRVEASTVFVEGLAEVVEDVTEFCLANVSVQPLIARERELLPELIRDREVIKMYTVCPLRSVDVEGKKRADRIDWQDQEYVIQSVEDWTQHGGYYKVTAVKEDD